MSFKDIDLENSLSIEVAEAPIQIVTKEQMTLAVERMKVLVPDADKMSTAQLIQIANESLIYRTVPGRDMHYFIDRGKLCKVPDYKYMKNFADFREQVLSGDDRAVLDESYTILSEEDKMRHGVPTNKIAVKCTIITARERKAFAAEVKQWLDLGFSTKDALGLARETYGELGTSAVGVVKPGGEYDAPNGWSPLQKAEKLAFKNAVNRKYGIPTADEMKSMAQRMAYRAMPEDWKNVDPSLPREQQARYAELEAATREVKEARARMNAEEKAAQFKRNVDLMRGEEDSGIGDPVVIIDATQTDTGEWSPTLFDAGDTEPQLEPAPKPQPSPVPPVSPKAKAPDWPASGPASDFCKAVQLATGNYYTSSYHLSNAIGGYGNLKDDDNWNSKLSAAVDHASQKRAETQTPTLFAAEVQSGGNAIEL